MKFSHFVPNKISYTMICILLFFPHVFYLNFILYSQNFWKCREHENISYLVGLNFISIIDGWNNLSLYQYMSWAVGCRTPMTIYKLEKPWFPLHWLGTNFCLVLPQLLNVLPWLLICLSSNFNRQCFRD